MTSGRRRPATSAQRRRHWDALYRESEPRARSWYQDEPTTSLEMIALLGVDPSSAVVDVGGGDSVLVDRLIDQGFSDLAVLDVAPAALAAGRRRLGVAAPVTWVVEDLLAWRPARRYALWHDRAVLHFLVDSEVDEYRAVLERTLAPGGAVVLGTFAPDGPASCSGLAVRRYGADELADLLGPYFRVVTQKSEEHVTPTAALQHFTWVAARRRV